MSSIGFSRPGRRVTRLGAALTFALVALAGCGHTDAPTTLRLPLLTAFFRDPARATISQIWAESLVYSGLYQLDGSLNVVPDLAVAMPTISPNGKIYTIGIEPGAKFANGGPITAWDVAFSLSRALSKRENSSAARFALADIAGSAALNSGAIRTLTGVRVLNKLTLAIRIRRPDPNFLTALALPAASILDQVVVSRHADWPFRGASTGPFRLAEMGNPLILRSNPNYLEGKLSVRTLDLRRLPSREDALAMYRRRQLDAVALPGSKYDAESASAGFVWSDTQLAYYLALPEAMPQAERKSVSESLNTSSLASQGSPIDPLSTLVPTALVPGYPATPNPFPYQPIAGRAGLSGLAMPPLVESGISSSQVDRWLTSRLRSSYAPPGARAHRARKVGPAIRLVGVRPRFPSAGSWLRVVGRAEWGSVSGSFAAKLEAGNRANVTQGIGPEITDYGAAETMLLQTALVIPIGIQKQGYLVSSRLQGMQATPLGLEPSNESWTSVSLS